MRAIFQIISKSFPFLSQIVPILARFDRIIKDFALFLRFAIKYYKKV